LAGDDPARAAQSPGARLEEKILEHAVQPRASCPAIAHRCRSALRRPGDMLQISAPLLRVQVSQPVGIAA